mgnify:CR=1 FL=1
MTVAVWTTVSRVTGMARVIVIGAVLGPTFFGNAYQLTNVLPNLVFYGFLAGSLLSSLLVPALVFVFFRIHHHYKDVAEALSLENASRFRIASEEVVTLLLVDGVHLGTLEMVDFAKALGNPWHAIHVGVNPQKSEVTQKKWDQYVSDGYVVRDGNRIELTMQGLLRADGLLPPFFEPEFRGVRYT